MSAPTPAGYSIEHQIVTAACHLVKIDVHPPASTADRDRLLTSGVVEVIAALVQAYESGQPVVLDLRLHTESDGVHPASEAYLEAVRGLVQSFVLENPVPVRPVNVLVTTAGQDAERERTVSYLSSAGGTFSCGATYDLREGRR